MWEDYKNILDRHPLPHIHMNIAQGGGEAQSELQN